MLLAMKKAMLLPGLQLSLEARQLRSAKNLYNETHAVRRGVDISVGCNPAGDGRDSIARHVSREANDDLGFSNVWHG